MQQQDNGDCIALIDDRCVIYDQRPQICRAFERGGRWCEKARMQNRFQPSPARGFFMGA